jgi:hypothetical protein
MLCPQCKVEMRLSPPRYRVSNNKLFIVQDYICRSKQCPNYDKVVETRETELEAEIEQN